MTNGWFFSTGPRQLTKRPEVQSIKGLLATIVP